MGGMNPDQTPETKSGSSEGDAAEEPVAYPQAVDPHPLTEDDLSDLFRRAMRMVAWMGLALAGILTIAAGWQTGLLMLAGASISWTGILEWRNLSNLVFDRMDQNKPARPVGRTASLFFLRLGIAAAILYVSLRCLHGNVYALVGGLGLAVVALTFEALRYLRG